MLYDNHNRRVNYLRLAVTDRCNLRCFYCMPEEGIKYVKREQLLSYEEMERIVTVMASMGIEKVRITGGEPFVRRGMLEFMQRLKQIEGIKKINLTTNGTLTDGIIPELKKIVASVNLSMDSLNRERFFEMTRRDELPKVLQTLDQLLANDIPTKINCVVMANRNTQDILPMVELAKNQPVSVRFIEEMPFNGAGAAEDAAHWNYRDILSHIKTKYPDIQKIPDPPFSTSANYQIPNHRGTVGIIAAYSRTFCGTCNRIRMTPQGILKTCLYDEGVFNLRDILRAGATNEQLKTTLLDALGSRAKDGWEAEQRRTFGVSESMATIGG
ncbi:MAG: GTP 3',8-cyclase MoaA [Saprospiraceae bacterium]